MSVYPMWTYQIKDRLVFAIGALIVLMAIYVLVIILIASKPLPKPDETKIIQDYFSGTPVVIWENVDENGYPLPGVFCIYLECLDKVVRPVYCFTPLPDDPKEIMFWERRSKYFSLPISDYMIAYDNFRFFRKDPFELINSPYTSIMLGP